MVVDIYHATLTEHLTRLSRTPSLQRPKVRTSSRRTKERRTPDESRTQYHRCCLGTCNGLAQQACAIRRAPSPTSLLSFPLCVRALLTPHHLAKLSCHPAAFSRSSAPLPPRPHFFGFSCLSLQLCFRQQARTTTPQLVYVQSLHGFDPPHTKAVACSSLSVSQRSRCAHPGGFIYNTFDLTPPYNQTWPPFFFMFFFFLCTCCCR